MSIMTVAARAITAITVIVTTTMEAVGVAARTGLDRPTIPVAASPKSRRRAVRISGVSRPIAMIRPQYLPALARARSLRLQMAHLAIATPRRR
jgi:hypothetical protein